MKNFCLTIAGSDPTSGAGIQADIRTFDRCGVHPFSAITAITYQSATEFHGYKSLSDTLDSQLDAILRVYPIKYVKIGMIPDSWDIELLNHIIFKQNFFLNQSEKVEDTMGENENLLCFIVGNTKHTIFYGPKLFRLSLNFLLFEIFSRVDLDVLS